jgi:hypothetical protein
MPRGIYPSNKGRIPWNRLPRETRVCVCGCKKTFECRINSVKKYILGHNKSLLGKHHSEVSNEKNRQKHLGIKMSVNSSIKKSVSLKKKWDSLSEEERNQWSKGSFYKNEEHRKKVIDKIRPIVIARNKSIENREKVSKANQEFWTNLPETEFNRKVNLNLRTFKDCLKGHYYSAKNNAELYYQSSYELRAYQKLEDDFTVKSYQRCDFSVPYIYENENHRYLPDILVEYHVGYKEVIEIKPSPLVNYPKNIAKRQALQRYCEANGLLCSTWTEQDLELQLVG